MVFVTYAQTFEDLMLWRALKHVRNGFYIDLGASEPVIDSVTLAFYERGWSGINVEPAPETFGRLAAARPRDVNLNIAIGAENGERDFYLVNGGNGLSTFSQAMSEQFQSAGWTIEPTRTPVRRLADICRDYVRGPIHFLKIDIEGAEREALEGADLQTWRPWVILLEATVANTQIPTHEEWEGLLLEQRYRMIYADGLNRFYLAEEHEDLAGAFATPPNVFDNYIRYSENSSREEVRSLRNDLDRLTAERQAFADRTATTEEHLAATTEQLSMTAGQLAKTTGQLEAERLIAERLTAERDHATQEMWESNRLAVVLAADRQKLLDQMNERAPARPSAELQAVYASTSWRITAPLRALVRMGRAR